MSGNGPSVAQKALALAALTMTSTCIGYFMKVSQIKGKYKFNPASAVVMAEAFKLMASLIIVCRLLMKSKAEKAEKGTRSTLKDEARKFIEENISPAVIWHELGLAVAYMVVNVVTYAIFVHATASMFFLLKAASPVITAILLRFLVQRNVSMVQWVSVVMQCVGLVVTQYNPCTKSGALGTLGYLLICINIVVSCVAGVWNESVIKTYGTSVNAQNIVLYFWGIVVNLLVYSTLSGTWFGMTPEDAASMKFFDGYNMMVVCVIIANGSVGLVITAVYKYADVVIKTFGLAGSTVLLYLMEASGVLPSGGNTVSLAATLIGTCVVFYAAYLYMAPARTIEVAPSVNEANAASEEGRQPESRTLPMPMMQDGRVFAMAILGVGASFTVLISSNYCDVNRL